MIRFIKLEWKFFVMLLVGLIVLGVIYYEWKQYKSSSGPPQQQQPNIIINTAGEKGKQGEPQIVYVQGQNTNTKEIIYVPKEVDPVTGKQEKTDVEFAKKENKVYVKVNGKEYEVPAEVKEDVKFDKGKLVVTEESQVRISLTTPKPSVNLGLGWSAEGPAGQINGPLYKNVSWWLYGDRKTVAGGLQFPIMK